MLSYSFLQIKTLAILCLHDEKGGPLKWIDSPLYDDADDDGDDDENDEKGAPIETDSPPS